MADRDPVTAAPRVVTLPAEMDLANTDALGEQFAAAFASGVPAVIADMSAGTAPPLPGHRNVWAAAGW